MRGGLCSALHSYLLLSMETRQTWVSEHQLCGGFSRAWVRGTYLGEQR